MSKKGSTYRIDLDIKSSAQSKQTFKELEKASKEGFDNLNTTYRQLAESVSDTTELEKQYQKVVDGIIKAKDKEIDKLEQQKVVIAANTKLSKEERENEIKKLDTQVKQTKLSQKEIKTRAKLEKAGLKAETTRFKLSEKLHKIQDGILKAQNKLNEALSKESKLRSKIGGAVGKVGKAGLKVGAGALGVAGMAAGAALASVGAIAQKDQALKALKSGIDPKLVDELYVATGADYGAIVNAINMVASNTKDLKDIKTGALLEIQNPGAFNAVMSNSEVGSADVQKMASILSQIKSQTGVADLSEIMNKSMQSKIVTSGDISRTEYMQAYAALQSKGFDETAIERIIRTNAKKGGNFLDNLNSDDLSKYTRDAQFKSRLKNGGQLELTSLDANKEVTKTDAELAAAKLRELEIKKDEAMRKLIPLALQIIEAIEPLIEPVMKTLNAVLPLLKTFITIAQPIVQSIIDVINKVVETILDALEELPVVGDDIKEARESSQKQNELEQARQRQEKIDRKIEEIQRNEQVKTINQTITNTFPVQKDEATGQALAGSVGNAQRKAYA